MKRHTLVLVLLISGMPLSGIWAQATVLSSGGDASAPMGSVSFSVGQVAYTSQSSQSGEVNAGVQQPIEVLMVGNTGPFADLTLRIYPNPTMDKLILELSDEFSALGQHTISLYDLYGKLLMQESILNSSVVVPLDAYAQGMYLLKVSNNKDVIKTFKVIKTN